MMVRLRPALACAVLGASAAVASSSSIGDEAIRALMGEALRLAPHVETRAARELLAAVPDLPAIEPRTVHYRRAADGLEALDAAAFAARPEAERGGWRTLEVDTARWYGTFYGSPLASVRALDLAAAAGGWDSFAGRRVLDFGYGSIGQLRLLAACGASVVGTEVMSLLEVMYDGAEGPVEGRGGRAGAVDLAWGRWPADTDVAAQVGDGVDLLVSKNTLKRGYVRPRADAPPGSTIDLGVTPVAFLRAVHDVLAPGGLVVVYNIGGVPADGAPALPMHDVAFPWTPAECADAGLELVAHDVDDGPALRAVGRALGWDEGPDAMDLEAGVRARYTILRRPG